MSTQSWALGVAGPGFSSSVLPPRIRHSVGYHPLRISAAGFRGTRCLSLTQPVSSHSHMMQKAVDGVSCSLRSTASTSELHVEVSCRRPLFLRYCVLLVGDLKQALITQLGLIYIVCHAATSGSFTTHCRSDSRYDEVSVSRAVPSMYRLSSQHQLFAATHPHTELSSRRLNGSTSTPPSCSQHTGCSRQPSCPKRPG